jgi:hypothetical protein
VVDAAFIAFVRAGETPTAYALPMPDYFLSGRAALDDAMSLVAEYGPDAPAVAAARASASRDKENVLGYCHWRQIERFTNSLATGHEASALH